GGSAFIFDEAGDFPQRCNLEMVALEPLQEADDLALVRDLLIQHAGYTGSTVAARVLRTWDQAVEKFIKVMPVDYRRMLNDQQRAAKSSAPVPVEVTRG
ncbi:MAG: hypothetical protein ABI353_16610, partial [Isosphaeraceae bacterium]